MKSVLRAVLAVGGCVAAGFGFGMAPVARGLDLPVDIGFQLGFRVRVVPGAGDHARALGLVVRPDKIHTDKTRRLTVTGTITNFSPVVCRDVAMRFAVTSYIGSGKSLGRAVVEPADIPPGGTADFVVRISLDDPRPRDAVYTVTASSPLLYGTGDGAPGLPPEVAGAIAEVLVEAVGEEPLPEPVPVAPEAER